ncbi:CD9 antigen-like isoform X1 [Physella acuta]|uniref:CD9 antigen-like isoform X1 n=1 Tax=Physella acuta TaxID=109671 RepID=UPI0027DC7757|nr:CD9 antigen-like isoform X1 [Physella acuta]
MALGSCYTCIKYLMFAFNFLFWLLGCAILGVGIWLRVDQNAAEFLKDSPKLEIIHTAAYVLIAIGFLIMVIGFLGCCGAIRENQCLLATFFLFLFIIFATLLGFGIWAAVARQNFKDITADMLKEGVEKYYEDSNQKAFMDTIQTSLNCCGHTAGNIDYNVVSGVPQSCLPDNYDKPCNDALYSWLESRLIIIAGIAIGIAVVMILGMIFSMVLCCAIRDTVA